MKKNLSVGLIGLAIYGISSLIISSTANGANVDPKTNLLCTNYMNNVGILCGSTFANGGNSFGGATTIGTNDLHDLGIETNNTVRVTFKTDGKVGIGTTNPGANLEVAGSVKITGGAPGAGKVLTSDATGLASWQNPTGGGGTGSVTSVTSANSYLSIASPTTTPVITANVGTTANTLAAGNDARILNAVQSSAYAADLAPVTSCSASQKPSWNTITDVWECVAIASLNGSVITSGIISTSHLGTGTASNTTYLRGDGTWAPPASTVDSQWTTSGANIYFNTGNVGLGTATPSAKLEVAGQLKITGGSPGAGKVLTSDPTGLATWTTLSGSESTSVSNIGSAGVGVFKQMSSSNIELKKLNAANGAVTVSDDTINNKIDIGLNAELTGLSALSSNGLVKRTAAGTYSSVSSVNLASDVSGVLSIANGGTNATTSNTALNNLLPSQATHAGKVLLTDGVNTSWGVGNSGTVNSVTSANSYLTITATTTSPVITANVGTSANTLAAGNDSRITGALAASAYDTDLAPAANCLASQKPVWNATTTLWECISIGSLNASAIIAGTINIARIGTGTANNTTYLRGDGIWATPTGGGGGTSQWTTTGNDISYSTGNVGIGTASPTASLDIQNTLSSSSGIALGMKLQSTINQTGTAGYTGFQLNVTEPSIGSGTKLLMDLQKDGVSKFKVDRSGNLTAYNNISGNWGLFGGSVLASGYFGSAFAVSSPYTATGTTSHPSSPGGNLRLENYSWGDNNYTSQTLTVNNSSGKNQNAYIGAVSTTGSNSYTPSLVFGLQNAAATYAEVMRINSTGNVGIGLSAPTTKLQVAGVIAPAADAFYNLGSSSLRFYEIYALNGAINTSDAREKKEVVESDLGLDFISILRPVSYRWKEGKDSGIHYGLIAQETEKAVIQVKGNTADQSIVTYDDKSDRYGIRYTELISPMIKAVQELNEQSSTDRQEIEKLKMINAKLEARLEALEKVIQSK